MSENRSTEWLARKLAEYDQRISNVESKPNLAYSSIDDGSLVVKDEAGVVSAQIGKQSDGTFVAVSLNGPKPTAPSAPQVTDGVGIVSVTWDGKLSDPNLFIPMDFANVEVHISRDENFTYNRANLAGVISSDSGGTKTFAADEGQWYVHLIVKSMSGQRSDPSVNVPVMSQPPAVQDVREPSAPLNLTDVTTLKYNTAGYPVASVTLSWSAVSTATDGTNINISNYEVWGRKGTDAYTRVATAEALSAGFDIDPGSTWNFKVRAMANTSTTDGAFSSVRTVTAPTDTLAPPVPTAPAVATWLRTVTVRWAGTPSMPVDFSHINVYQGTTKVGRITDLGFWQSGTMPAGVALSFSLTAVDKSGNESAKSPSVSVTPTANVDVKEISNVIDAATIELKNVGESSILAGAVTAEKVTASEEMWAKVLGAHKINADEINTNSLTSDQAFIGNVWSAGLTIGVPTTNLTGTVTNTQIASGITGSKITGAVASATSAASATNVTGAVGSAVNLPAGQLTSGTLKAGTTVSTNAGTAKVTIDPTGIKAYNSAGTKTVSINSDGSAEFTGKITMTDGTVPEGNVTGLSASIASASAAAVTTANATTASASANAVTAANSAMNTALAPVAASASATKAKVDPVIDANGKVLGAQVSGTVANATNATSATSATSAASATNVTGAVGSAVRLPVAQIKEGVLPADGAIKTGTGTSRVELSNTGLKAFQNGTQTVGINSDGTAFFKGSIEIGSSVPMGAVTDLTTSINTAKSEAITAAGVVTASASAAAKSEAITSANATTAQASAAAVTAANAVTAAASASAKSQAVTAANAVTATASANAKSEAITAASITTASASAQAKQEAITSANATTATASANAKSEAITSANATTATASAAAKQEAITSANATTATASAASVTAAKGYTDTTVAPVAASASATKALTDGWKFATSTKIDGGNIQTGTVSATQISATAIDGMVITGATVQTTATAARGVKLDSTGLKAYDTAGNPTVVINSDGSASFKGSITIGSAVPPSVISGTLAETQLPTISQTKVANLGTTIASASAAAVTAANATTATASANAKQEAITSANATTASASATAKQEAITAAGLVTATAKQEAIDSANATTASASAQAVSAANTNTTNAIAPVATKVDATIGADNKVIGSQVGGSIPVAAVPNLSATKITSGTFPTTTKVADGSLNSGISPTKLTGTGTAPVNAIPTIPQSKVQDLPTKLVEIDGITTRVVDWTFTGTTQIDGGHIQADTISAQQISATAITASHLAGKTMTAGLVETEASANRGVKFNSTGITAYDLVGNPTVVINADGTASFKGSITVGSSVPAATVSGALDATNIPALDATKITTGTLPAAVQVTNSNIATGIQPSKLTGTGTIPTAAVPSLDATKITSGTLPTGVKIADGSINTGISPSKLTGTGTIPTAGIPALDATKITTGTLPGAVKITDTSINTGISPSKLTGSGTIPVAGVPALPTSKVTNLDTKISEFDTSTALVNGWKFTGTTEIDGGKIKADSVSAVQIAANSITADRLAIADQTNYVFNGAGEVGAAGWAAGLIPDTTDKPLEVITAFKSTAGQDTFSHPHVWMDVTPNTEYVASVWLKADKPNSKVYIDIRDQDGLLTSGFTAIPGTTFGGAATRMISNLVLPTVWTKYTAKMVTSPTARKIRISSTFFNHIDGTERTAVQHIAGMNIQKRSSGVLLVDGAIDGKTITGAVINGSEFNYTGTGAGVGYDLSIKSDSLGSLVQLETPGDVTPSIMRASQDGLVDNWSIRAPGLSFISGTSESFTDPAKARLSSGGYTELQPNVRWYEEKGFKVSNLHVQDADSYITFAGKGEVFAEDAIRLIASFGGGYLSGEDEVTVSGRTLGSSTTRYGARLVDVGTGEVLGLMQNSNGGILRSTTLMSTTTTLAANMWSNTSGYIYRSTSSAKYKLAVKDLPEDYEDKILSLRATTWYDKTQSENLAEWHERQFNGDPVVDENGNDTTLSPDKLRRIPGMIAEEVAAAGLDEFVQYGDDGEIEGLMYDRLGVATIPIIARQRDRIVELESKVADQEARLADLEAKMEALLNK